MFYVTKYDFSYQPKFSAMIFKEIKKMSRKEREVYLGSW